VAEDNPRRPSEGEPNPFPIRPSPVTDDHPPPHCGRLVKEYKDLSKERLEESMFVAGPISEDDFYEWEALVIGPEGTPYVRRVWVDESEESRGVIRGNVLTDVYLWIQYDDRKEECSVLN
jgi:hypothetical protein